MNAIPTRVIGSGTRDSRRVVACSVFLATMLCVPLRAAVIYVRFDAPPGGDGTSWATAYRQVSPALAASGTNDEIWVARGAYFPDESPAFPAGNGDRSATFHVQGNRKLIGGFAGTESNSGQRDVALNPTILCGDLDLNDGPNYSNLGDNSYNVVDTTGSTALALIDGFVIAGGYGNSVGQNPHSVGAGIFGGYPPGNGGRATIRDCRIQSNYAFEDGAAAYGHDGMFANCIIANNVALDVGGGLASCSGPLINCVISGNIAAVGAALFDCNGDIHNCLIARNVGDLGAISGGSGALWNCTITGHSPALPTVRFYSGTITNCIIYGNAGPALSASSVPTYSCIQGGSSGAGDISADPQFVDVDGPDNNPATWEDNDYRLLTSSPCVDSGDNSALSADLGDLDGDGNLVEPIPFDLWLSTRRAEIFGMANVGVGSAPVVDMGAYETHCPGDLDGDGHVDLTDLALLLAHFGARPMMAVDGDLNHDRVVDLADLGLLLASFGTSC